MENILDKIEAKLSFKTKLLVLGSLIGVLTSVNWVLFVKYALPEISANYQEVNSQYVNIDAQNEDVGVSFSEKAVIFSQP